MQVPKRPALLRLRVLLAILGLVATGIVGSANPAKAYTITCGGYGQTPSFACVSFTGFSGQQPWGYPVDANGHNCTNYVTYRLWQNGVPNPGNLGNAKDWDNNAITYGLTVNNTPAVGTVAVWEAYSGPALEAGHVAYVDAVTSAYIDISEDNYGGTTMRKRFYVSQSDWPDHFIHFGGTPPSSPPQQKRGDVTGDNRADLIGVSKGGDGTPWMNVFAANSGAFDSPTVWAHPTTGWADWDAKVWLSGDFGTDGKTDILGISKAGDGTPYVYVFPSRGDHFGDPVLWAHPTTGWANWDTKRWLAGDVTGDGKADLIGITKAGDGTPYIYVFKSTGSGFASPVLWAHPTTGWANWDTKVWLVDDFGTDGKADLLGISKGGDGTPYVYVFPSRGDHFDIPVLWSHPTTGWTDWDAKVWLSGDTNGDNRADLVGISKGGDGTPYVNVFVAGSSAFSSPQLWAHPTDGWTNWEAKRWLINDYGTDGKADLVGITKAGDGTPYVYIFPSRGNYFDSPVLWAHPTDGWADWSAKVWR